MAVSASSAAVPAIPEEEKKPGFLGIAPITWKKIVPLGFMFFCILFNYTILRDTKARPFCRRRLRCGPGLFAEPQYAGLYPSCINTAH